MNDHNFRWYVCLLAVIVLAGVIGSYFELAAKEKTKQEAIKAGLVQDADGHWVRLK